MKKINTFPNFSTFFLVLLFGFLICFLSYKVSFWFCFLLVPFIYFASKKTITVQISPEDETITFIYFFAQKKYIYSSSDVKGIYFYYVSGGKGLPGKSLTFVLKTGETYEVWNGIIIRFKNLEEYAINNFRLLGSQTHNYLNAKGIKRVQKEQLEYQVDYNGDLSFKMFLFALATVFFIFSVQFLFLKVLFLLLSLLLIYTCIIALKRFLRFKKEYKKYD